MNPVNSSTLKPHTPKPSKEELNYTLGLGTLALTCWITVGLPIGPKVVPFWGSYLEFYKVYNPKKELLWGLWVELKASGA